MASLLICVLNDTGYHKAVYSRSYTNRNKAPSSIKTKDLTQKHNAVESFSELDKPIVQAGGLSHLPVKQWVT